MSHFDPRGGSLVEPRSNNASAAGLSSHSHDAAAKKLKAGQANAPFDIARGNTKKHGLYFSQRIVSDKQHPLQSHKDRMGSRVERVGFAWERGKVVGP